MDTVTGVESLYVEDGVDGALILVAEITGTTITIRQPENALSGVTNTDAYSVAQSLSLKLITLSRALGSIARQDAGTILTT